jgi:bla regulator protein BlaR1
MNELNTFWTSALSMTLLHSLWQGFVIIVSTVLFLKLFKIEKASAKYIVKVTGLFFHFAVTVFTFILLIQAHRNSAATQDLSLHFSQASSGTLSNSAVLVTGINEFLLSNQSWIVIGWLLGVALFSLRFSAAVLYLKFIKQKASPLQQQWRLSIQKLSQKLGVEKVVELYESVHIQTPIVIGYFKPVILMPIGLIAGLSPQQVEVILIHELAHIRRHDYLVNFVQSLGETIFFFNPFVWILSGWIRNERENCCDDVVLQEGYDPQLYANTLFELESSRHQNGNLALALTGNKNLLLNRIKRIMERSAKNQNGREKFIPVLLLVLGLVFASWLSISPQEKIESKKGQKSSIATDTTKKSKSAGYSRKSIITFDEKGDQHEVITEEFDGDESPFALLAAPDIMDAPPEITVIPEINGFPALPGFPRVADLNTMGFQLFDKVPFPGVLDSVPELWDERDEERWAAFEKKFTQDFKGKFGAFYSKNEAEIARVMAEAQREMSQMDKRMSEESFARFSKREAPFSEEAMLKMEKDMQDMEEKMQLSSIDMEKMAEEMRAQEGYFKEMETNMKALEVELKEQLVKDGYLSPNEEIHTMNISDDHMITINGKKIKEKDQPKYKEIQKKHQPKKRNYHRPE